MARRGEHWTARHGHSHRLLLRAAVGFLSDRVAKRHVSKRRGAVRLGDAGFGRIRQGFSLSIYKRGMDVMARKGGLWQPLGAARCVWGDVWHGYFIMAI